MTTKLAPTSKLTTISEIFDYLSYAGRYVQADGVEETDDEFASRQNILAGYTAQFAELGMGVPEIIALKTGIQL